ncbi:hypothetical protein [Streptomyces venetus]|uniref:hypothetical protein n=1 Tax=Streptomyces venetus TaxID=1701086 RepID=UPI003C2DBF8A
MRKSRLPRDARQQALVALPGRKLRVSQAQPIAARILTDITQHGAPGGRSLPTELMVREST